jgi:FkbM family methyltransferase
MSAETQMVRKSLAARAALFLARPWREKIERVRARWLRAFPRIPFPMRLPFGAWWLARNDNVGLLISEKRFEIEELSFVRSFLQPGMTVLDIGAHHGLYTLLASKRVGPTGKVIAFEPSQRERKTLRHHLVLNRCQNVIVQELALGNESAECGLYVVEHCSGACNSLKPPATDAKTTIARVRMARLDDVLLKHNIDQVNFIKLDVEGAEREVFKGAARLLDCRPRPVILVEVQDIRTEPWGYRAKDIICYLSARGFKWFRLSAGGCLQYLDLAPEVFDGNFVAWPEELAKSIPVVST